MDPGLTSSARSSRSSSSRRKPWAGQRRRGSMPAGGAPLFSPVALLLTLVGVVHSQTPAQTVTDSRDGYRYPVVAIGGLRWFAENLRFRTADSRCYENDDANCE